MWSAATWASFDIGFDFHSIVPFDKKGGRLTEI